MCARLVLLTPEPAFLPAPKAILWKYLLHGAPRTLEELFVSTRAVHALGSLTVVAFVDKQGAAAVNARLAVPCYSMLHSCCRVVALAVRAV